MVKITIDYKGELRCSALHGPSGCVLSTDAPVDNNGKGESFSPSDLVATALGSCMATIMGIVAARKDIDLTGLEVTVSKEMSQDMPRRISCLSVQINVPNSVEKKDRLILENAALTCPVHQSLHSDIKVPIEWVYS